ncbi:AlpA family transcriptional regulator [Pseudomonas aeruginosa]|nr:AlpA family transcriptional regulator [Pseudomonas aeruginosa]
MVSPVLSDSVAHEPVTQNFGHPRLKEVMDLTSLARSTIYKYIALGTFPLPLSVGERCVRWLESEVHEWILERIAERDEKLQAVGKH